MFKVSELLKASRGKLILGNKDSDISGVSTDSRSIHRGEVFLAIKGANFDGHEFIAEALKRGARCIIGESLSGKIRGRVLSGVSFIEVANSERALGDIARFHRGRFDIPVIAVTGSNGKTTTKEMLACVLSSRYKVLRNEGTKNNQIGLPLTLLKLDSSYDLCTVELGTNHFGEIAYLSGVCQPNIGILTNIGPSHLAYLRNTAGVFKEKSSLIENLLPPELAILNADDSFLRRELLKKTKRPFTLGFGIKNAADFFATGIKKSTRGWGFQVKGAEGKYAFTLATRGYYNIYNALAAIAIARIFGISYKDISRELSGFHFPKSRMEIIKSGGITFIDDTYNANPVSLTQALDALEGMEGAGRKILVLGDMLELGEEKNKYHYQAGMHAARVADILITVGKLSRLTGKGAREAGISRANIFSCRSSVEAKEVLSRRVSLEKNDVVLVKGSRLMRMEEVLKARRITT